MPDGCWPTSARTSSRSSRRTVRAPATSVRVSPDGESLVLGCVRGEQTRRGLRPGRRGGTGAGAAALCGRRLRVRVRDSRRDGAARPRVRRHSAREPARCLHVDHAVRKRRPEGAPTPTATSSCGHRAAPCTPTATATARRCGSACPRRICTLRPTPPAAPSSRITRGRVRGAGQHVDVSAMQSVTQATLSEILATAVGDPQGSRLIAKEDQRKLDQSGSGSGYRRHEVEGARRLRRDAPRARPGCRQLHEQPVRVDPRGGRVRRAARRARLGKGAGARRQRAARTRRAGARARGRRRVPRPPNEARARRGLARAQADRGAGPHRSSDLAESPQLEARDFWIELGQRRAARRVRQGRAPTHSCSAGRRRDSASTTPRCSPRSWEWASRDRASARGSARRRSHLGRGRACGRPRAGRLRRGGHPDRVVHAPRHVTDDRSVPRRHPDSGVVDPVRRRQRGQARARAQPQARACA